MGSIKTLLYTTIDLLSEREAREILKFTRLLKEKKEVSSTLNKLAVDETFVLPTCRPKAFRIVKPVQGKGTPASRLLIEDRR